MRIARCPSADREIKRLSKGSSDVSSAVTEFERLLSEGFAPPGDRYSQLGLKRGHLDAEVWKCRVALKHSGKKSGLRYVFERLTVNGDDWVICLGVYMHSAGVDEEHKRREAYRDRFKSLDVDSDLEGLEEFSF